MMNEQINDTNEVEELMESNEIPEETNEIPEDSKASKAAAAVIVVTTVVGGVTIVKGAVKLAQKAPAKGKKILKGIKDWFTKDDDPEVVEVVDVVDE